MQAISHAGVKKSTIVRLMSSPRLEPPSTLHPMCQAQDTSKLVWAEVTGCIQSTAHDLGPQWLEFSANSGSNGLKVLELECWSADEALLIQHLMLTAKQVCWGQFLFQKICNVPCGLKKNYPTPTLHQACARQRLSCMIYMQGRVRSEFCKPRPL